jgi:hypothetical protein
MNIYGCKRDKMVEYENNVWQIKGLRHCSKNNKMHWEISQPMASIAMIKLVFSFNLQVYKWLALKLGKILMKFGVFCPPPKKHWPIV